MKILIVSTFFPPQNSIASLRPYSWAKWWSRAGHEVTVLTTQKQKSPADLNKDFSGFKIIELPLPHLIKQKNVPSASSDNSEKNTAAQTSSKRNLLKTLLLWYGERTGCFNCRFPTLSDFWAAKAKKAVNPFDFDAVISTGGPYSVHFAAEYLKKKNPRLVWCVDWRDYWTQSAECHGSFFFRWWEKLKDRQFLQRSDFVTSVSDQFSGTYRTLTKKPVYTIYNGYDPDDFAETGPSEYCGAKLVILYAGTIYPAIQDPSPLYRGLVELCKEGKINKGDVKVLFCGRCGQAAEIAKKEGAEDFVEYIGFLSHEKTIALEKAADVVLFLGHDSPESRGVLTGKLFEYLYCAKEIWAVGISRKMQAGEFIEKAEAGKVFFTDVEKIKAAVMEKLLQKNSGAVIENKKDAGFIKQFERKAQAEFLLEKFMEKINEENILLISLNAPYDGVAHAGGKICNYYTKKFIAQGKKVTIISEAEKYEEKKIIADKEKYGYGSYVCYRSPLSKMNRTFNFVKRLFPFTFKDGFVSNEYKRHVMGNIRHLYKNIGNGGGYRIILDWTQSALLAKDIRKYFPQIHITAVEQDVSFQAQYRLYKNEKNLIKKILRYVIYKNGKHCELKALNECDKVKVLNDKDKKLLEGFVPAEKISVIAPYYDILSAKTEYAQNDKSIIFYGAMSRKENVDAVIWFIENVFNKLDGSYKFYIIGNKPDPILEKYKSENVILTGFVEDVSVYAKNALCFVVPLLQGAGIKVKVLEAFAMAVPVLTNDIGIEGIADKAQDGSVYLHCATGDDYVKNIKLLDADKNLSKSIGKSAFEYVLSNFNYKEGTY